MSVSPRTVRIAVLGDPDTGKTSLISTAANDTFDARPVPTLPPTKLPLDFTPERVPILLTDTSAKPEDARALDAVIRESDAVVVCFDPRKPVTLESVRTTWYPRVQAVNPDIPIILACCKADRLTERDSPSVRERVERVARDLPNVECCLNCSSKYNRMVHDVFYHALKAVLYPLQPLYDRTDRVIRQAAIRALKRVFIIFDQDKDGTLSDAEVNTFQSMCFGISLSAEELRGIKQVVRQQVPNGYTDTGLTLEGFLFLQGLFIERGRLETVWQVLRRFGYNDQLRLSDELLDQVNVRLPPDQVLELSPTAVAFLQQQFALYDARDEGMLSWEQLQGLFSTAPSLPTEWQNERVNRLMVCGTYGAVHNLEAFIARWRYCALTDPRGSLAHLLYLGYEGAPGDLLVKRQRRRPDKRHREELAERTTALCYVFGSAGCGKSTLLRALAGRRADADAAAGPGGAAGSGSGGAPPLTALATVRCDDGRDRTLALVEVPEDLTNELLTAATLSGRPAGSGASASHSGAAAVVGGALGQLLGGHSTPSTSTAAAATTSAPVGNASAASPGPSSSSAALAAESASSSAGAGPTAGATPPGAPGAGPSGPPGGASPAASSALSGFFSQAGGSSGAVYSLPDLSRGDCAVFLFDSTSADSWTWAHKSMLTLCGLPGCETLPVLLVATKDDVGMCGELRERVLAACGELALPDPLPVAAADMSAMGGVFRHVLAASFLAPEAHIPDTPARKDRRRLQRRLVIGGLALAAAALGGYCLYSMYWGRDEVVTSERGSTGSTGGSSAASGTSSAAAAASAAAAGSSGGVLDAPGVAGPEPSGGSSLGDRLGSLFSMPGTSFLNVAK